MTDLTFRPFVLTLLALACIPVQAQESGWTRLETDHFTLVSNADQLDFGIVACRKSLPSVQRIIDDLEASLAELEEAAGLPSPSA